jgi:hypothetical protein
MRGVIPLFTLQAFMTNTWLTEILNHLQMLRAFDAPKVLSRRRHQEIRNIEPDSTWIFRRDKPNEFKVKTSDQSEQ